MSISIQTAASADDIFNSQSTWGASGTGGTLNAATIGIGALTTAFYVGGSRHLNITITAGSTITSATITGTPAGTYTRDTNLEIYGVANSNPATFSNTSDTATGNIMSRPRTTAHVNWNVGTTSWSSAATVTSPDIKTIIQEIIDMPGWASGNAIAIAIYNAATSLPAVRADRAFYSWDQTGNASGPTLNISWTEPSGTRTDKFFF